MIIIETLPDGRTHTYSDAGLKIMQETGAVYDDAVDQIGVTHIYTETDIPIEQEEISAEEPLRIIMGGAANETE